MHGRFEPGTRLGKRYRIVGLLGRGGMGEVYRADDLELAQSVALKFLPERVAGDPVALDRFRGEVRTARQVAHANVCRIYDIAEQDGHVFLSMEYIDGEDLAGVLRRLGRPSREKAIEIARQICLGLAAAHENNVLHRDLKPANIMIDGRGRARITDFGLAGLADELEQSESRAGTPAYMAPEQLSDGNVSARSDIYSLGLILHELFTGTRVFDTNDIEELKRKHTGETVSTPSSISDEIDPAVERVIMRCLESQPQERPQSVYQVLAALPGGDPLAAALAAGETPSPNMVAQAGATGGLRPRVAVPLFVAFVGFLLLAMWLIDDNRVVSRLPMEKPPAVLLDRALTILRSFGYREAPGDVAYWFMADAAPLLHVARQVDRKDPWAPLDGAVLPLLRFEVRTSTGPMARLSWTGRISWTRPPFDQPGMTRLTLDTQGNLLHFEALPDDGAQARSNADHVERIHRDELDSSALFDATGLDSSGLTPIAPAFAPTVHCDHLAAWAGKWPGAPDIPLSVHAGVRKGRLAYVRQWAAWQDDRAPGQERGALGWAAAMLAAIGLVLMLRNLRAGRGDRAGAFRLAMFIFVIAMVRWLCTADHVGSAKELDLLLRAFGISCGIAVLTWAMYLAVEPYARRFWPQSLISWARLLSGRLRDARVGRDLLIGATAGAAMLCVPYAPWDPPDPDTLAPDVFVTNADLLLGGRYLPGQLCDIIIDDLPIAFGLLVLLLVLRILLRHTLLAGVALALLHTALCALAWGTFEWAAIVVFLMMGAAFAFIVTRFGLLAVIAMIVAWEGIERFGATFDFSHWYAGPLLVGPLCVLALAFYGFWVSLAGQPVFKDILTEPKATS